MTGGTFWPAGPEAWALSISTAAVGLAGLGFLYNRFTAPFLDGDEERRGLRPETALSPAPAAMPPEGPSRRPRISLLIPARNEEKTLPLLLERLCETPWTGLFLPGEVEVLIADDQSADATWAIAKQWASRFPFIRALSCPPLPEGWLGKNWACNFLASAARGDILLFCDADVLPTPEALSGTLKIFAAYGADAVSGLPRQLMKSPGEALLIPVILLFPVWTSIPLAQIPRLPLPALSLGCGQWFAFKRDAYDRIGGHGAVRTEVVEDIALGKVVKRAGLKLVFVLARSGLEVRMYRSFGEAWAGFLKNFHLLTGASWLRYGLTSLLLLFFHVLPFLMLALGHFAWALPAGGLLLLRLLIHGFHRDSLALSLLHPFGALLLPVLGFQSLRRLKAGRLSWKGRALPAPSAR